MPIILSSAILFSTSPTFNQSHRITDPQLFSSVFLFQMPTAWRWSTSASAGSRTRSGARSYRTRDSSAGASRDSPATCAIGDFGVDIISSVMSIRALTRTDDRDHHPEKKTMPKTICCSIELSVVMERMVSLRRYDVKMRLSFFMNVLMKWMYVIMLTIT